VSLVMKFDEVSLFVDNLLEYLSSLSAYVGMLLKDGYLDVLFAHHALNLILMHL